MRFGRKQSEALLDNAQRRFCSPQCQRRVIAAAHRARKAAT